MAETSETRRFHALDALRATAMELGLVLHAGVPYTRACPETWAFCDSSRTSAFDLLNTVIHAFRMPVFFLMSGFFAVLVVERIGTRAFVAHRLRRIALPLLVACAVIVPITRGVWIYGAFAGPGADLPGRYLPSVVAHFRDQGFAVFETIWHLWFLEYLLILTVAFLAVRWAGARSGLRGRGDPLAAALVSRSRALWLALPVIPAMAPMAGWNVDGIGEAVPVPHMLVYYGIFFAAGALLYRERARLDSLRVAWPQHIAAASGLLLAMMFVVSRRPRFSAASWEWIDLSGRAASGLLTCLLLFGVVGLFVERFARSRPTQRYLSDAAYFVYLTHFPLIVLLGIWVAHLGWTAFVKFGVVLGTAVLLLLTVYKLAVRHTVVGRTLHGPR